MTATTQSSADKDFSSTAGAGSFAADPAAAVSQHTPGPWHAGCFLDATSKCQCTFILSEGYCGSIAVVSVDNGKSIGDGGNDSPPLDEARANARLLAAAPELLDLLRHMLGAIDGNSIDSAEIDGDYESGIPPHKWHEQWAHYARAALAKATQPVDEVQNPAHRRGAQPSQPEK